MKPRPSVKLIDRLELLAFRERRIQGLLVGGLDKESIGWHAIEQALGLIQRHDPVRYRRILQDIERVWVRILPGAIGRFNFSLNACELDEKFVLAEAARPELIAATIVHEATHARLMHSGIGYDEGIRVRVEAVCFKREFVFSTKLPNGEEVREQAERNLAYYGTEHWTDGSLRISYEMGATQALRHSGMPEWLIRATFRINALVRKFAQKVGRGSTS
jgi:hypothetical protein